MLRGGDGAGARFAEEEFSRAEGLDRWRGFAHALGRSWKLTVSGTTAEGASSQVE